MAVVVRVARIGRTDVFSPCEFDLARMLRFPMIAVDFLHIAHKIHRDHETAARARAAPWLPPLIRRSAGRSTLLRGAQRSAPTHQALRNLERKAPVSIRPQFA